jgi:hypothetical protein
MDVDQKSQHSITMCAFGLYLTIYIMWLSKRALEGQILL